MIPGIYQLIDSALVHEFRFETVSNNLANIDTNAFKKDFISFEEALSVQYASSVDLSPGPLRHTGNSLDVALDSEGFFEIQTPDGSRYTRDGAFKLNGEGVLVTQNGYEVQGQNGGIEITGNNISIGADGQVLVDGASVDQIKVVDFNYPELLKKEGSSYCRYDGVEEDIVTVDNAGVNQGYIEGSNINLTEEMIKMVETMRAYESSLKAIQYIDEINGKMVNDNALLQ